MLSAIHSAALYAGTTTVTSDMIRHVVDQRRPASMPRAFRLVGAPYPVQDSVGAALFLSDMQPTNAVLLVAGLAASNPVLIAPFQTRTEFCTHQIDLQPILAVHVRSQVKPPDLLPGGAPA